MLKPSGGCHNCPRKRQGFVPATLTGAQLLALGEAPGAEEERLGEGFVGKSGQLLRQQFALEGIINFDVTNTIHCRPPENRNPTKKEISCCMNQYGLTEVEGYPFVVLVGGVAMDAYFPKLKSKNLRGNLAYHPDFPGQRFYGLIHPAAVLRNPHWRDAFAAHVNRLARILQGESEAPHAVIRGDSPDFIDRLAQSLDKTPTLSLDVETDGLKAWRPEQRMRAFACCSDEETGFFVHEGEPVWGAAKDLVMQKLQQRDTQLVGHNVGFEVVWFEREQGAKARCRTVIDSQTCYYLLKGWPQTSLKNLTSRELDGYRHLIHDPHKTDDVEQLGKYNTEDVVYPLRLVRKAMREMPPKMLDLCTRVYGPSCVWLSRVQTRGVHFFVDKWQVKKDEIEEQQTAIIEKWKGEDPDFDFPKKKGHYKISGRALERYIFETKKLPIIGETETGKPTLDAKAIQTWIAQHDASYLQNLLDWRGTEKQRSTYVEPYEGHLEPDGRVHPTYNNTKVKSGRLSSKDPNFQNLPRGPDIRQFFGARPGWVCGSGDYSQIELRIAFSLANDAVGIAAYNREGHDAHTETAEILAQLRGATEITKEDRSRAKPVNFALLYGGSAEGLQRYALDVYGVFFTDEEAQSIVKYFFKKYTGLNPWHKACNAEFHANQGWVESVLGFRIYYADWMAEDYAVRSHAERSALNSRVQGPAAHVCLYTGILADQEFIDRDMDSITIGTIHDSVVWESPPDEFDAAVRIMDTARARAYDWIKPWYKVPLVVDYEYGEDLGHLQEYELAA